MSESIRKRAYAKINLFFRYSTGITKTLYGSFYNIS